MLIINQNNYFIFVQLTFITYMPYKRKLFSYISSQFIIYVVIILRCYIFKPIYYDLFSIHIRHLALWNVLIEINVSYEHLIRISSINFNKYLLIFSSSLIYFYIMFLWVTFLLSNRVENLSFCFKLTIEI